MTVRVKSYLCGGRKGCGSRLTELLSFPGGLPGLRIFYCRIHGVIDSEGGPSGARPVRDESPFEMPAIQEVDSPLFGGRS